MNRLATETAISLEVYPTRSRETCPLATSNTGFSDDDVFEIAEVNPV